MKSDRGAIIIQVAVALLGLTLFSAFVLDYGIMWTARAQAQNAADAAALAGAISLTYDNTTTAEVKERARGVGLLNAVWNEPPDIQASDIEILPCPITPGFPTGDTCVKATAYRNQTRNNPLPTIFARLAGINTQGVVATATARAISGSTANCIKPWAVGDKWLEGDGSPWAQDDTFDGAAALPDTYVPPTPSNNYTGTGFSAKKPDGTPDYYGYQMILKLATPSQGQGGIPINSSGWAMELCLENTAASGQPCGTPAYNANITGCTTDTVNLSPWDAPACTSVNPAVGCIGVKTGSTGANNHTDIVDFIASHDPSATWVDGTGAAGWQTGTITNTTQSPSSRIAPVAIFSVPEYIAQDANGSGGIVRILKLVGFFIEGTCQESNYVKESYLRCPGGGNDKSAIVGRLVNYPASGAPGPAVGGFGQLLALVR